MQTTQLPTNNFNIKQLKLPLDFEIKIDNNDVVRTFDEVMKGINLKKYLITNTKGRNGYNPVKMLKSILFCYTEGIYSLRNMEKAMKNDIRLMWLTDELKPSFKTIGEFITKHLKENITEIFKEINDELIRRENINTSIMYIDGTKLEANANKYKWVWKKASQINQKKLFLKISKELIKMNETFKYDNVYFLVKDKYTTKELFSYKEYLEKQLEINEINLVYGRGKHKSETQRHYDKISEYLAFNIKYEKDLEICQTRNSYAKSDYDATFMRMKEDYMGNGQLKPGYNIQIGVSDEYIMHLGIYQDCTDQYTFIPFLKDFYNKYGYYPKYPVADAGYGSFRNYKFCSLNNLELYQKYTMYSKEKTDKKYLTDPFRGRNYQIDSKGNYICPNNRKMSYSYTKRKKEGEYISETKIYTCETCNRCLLKKQCKKGKKNHYIQINEELIKYEKKAKSNLESELGIYLRTQRSIQVEGAFGVIKEDMGYRRLKRRGLKNVILEMYLVAIGYNLLKYHRKKYRITI